MLEPRGQTRREDARRRRRVVVGVVEDHREDRRLLSVHPGAGDPVEDGDGHHHDVEGGEQPEHPAAVEVRHLHLAPPGLFVQEQSGDEEAAEHEEGVERHGGPGYDQQVGNGQDHVHVGHEDDEHGESAHAVEGVDLPEAARGRDGRSSRVRLRLSGVGSGCHSHPSQGRKVARGSDLLTLPRVALAVSGRIAPQVHPAKVAAPGRSLASGSPRRPAGTGTGADGDDRHRLLPSSGPPVDAQSRPRRRHRSEIQKDAPTDVKNGPVETGSAASWPSGVPDSWRRVPRASDAAS